MRKTLRSPNSFFVPEDIILRDDAFHGSKYRFCGEWWYFDAVFDNGYSVNAVVVVISKRKYGIVIPILNIYKNSKLKFHRRELRRFNEFSASKSIPHVKLSGKDAIKGYIDEEIGNWVYDVSLEMSGQKIDLQFIGIMKGWKGETPVSKWGAILPKAIVKGTITLDGETINVDGVGYHDHNWEVNFPFMQRGWYWGRFGGDSLNLVWSKIIIPGSRDILLGVLNEGRSNYINIKPEKIQLLFTDYRYDRGKKISTDFVLQVDDKNESIRADVRMKAVEVSHHVKMPVFNYWRYHVHATGHISYGTLSENIDRVDVIEFLKIL